MSQEKTRPQTASPHLLNDVRAELLHGQGAHVTRELADNRVAEAVVIQVENVLHHLAGLATSASEHTEFVRGARQGKLT